MKVVRVDEVPPVVITPHPVLTGRVSLQTLIDQNTAGNADGCHIAMVNFEPGSKNFFHTHNEAQILIVTAGMGIVATEQEEFTVSTGTVIFIPAGEKHWHGATPTSAFSHLTITPRPVEVTATDKTPVKKEH